MSEINQEAKSNQVSTNDLSLNTDEKTLKSSTLNDSGNSNKKSSTVISIKNSTVMKGDKLHIYLKDSSNKAISGQDVIFKIFNSNYTRTTDKNGMASLAIKLSPKNYNISVSYNGNELYKSSMKDFTLTVSKVNTVISIQSTSVVRGKYLYAYLKDKNNNALSNKKVAITLLGKTYSRTTDKNGRAEIKLSLKTGTYSTKISFAGDSTFKSSTLSKSIKIYTKKTVITIPNTSVIRGKSIIAYLKDSDGNALSGQKVVMKFDTINFNLKTDSNGKVALKINTRLGKIPVKASFAGSTSYSASSKSVTITSYIKKTVMTIPNTSVIRGKSIIAYLKDSDGNALSGQKVVMKFDTINFNLKTDSNGKVALKINTRLGKIPVKASFAGSTSYSASSKSVTITSYVEKTKIVIDNSTIRRGKCFNAYLKDSSNKGLSNEKVIINFSNKNYTKTTDSNGKVSLKIDANPGNYSVKVSFAKTNSYYASSKSLNLHVLNNVSAKITAKDQTTLGEYSVRLTDLDGNPLANQTISITASTTNRTAGTGTPITKKTIVLNSDNIYNKEKDTKFLNDIASVLRSNGYKVIVNSKIGPNSHCTDVMGDYSDVCLLCIFGGVDSGMFVDMSAKWYKNYMKKYNIEVVLGFTYTQRNLATDTWLERAHDDDYSPANFTGLSYPGTYLNDNGYDYIYGRTATEIANNFLNYAVKGLSIGLNNTIPCTVKTYNVTTGDNGYATISGLSAGTYTVVSSYSNKTAGYVSDTVKSYITVK